MSFKTISFARIQAFLQSISFTGAQMIWVALYLSISERLGLTPAQILVAFAVGSALFLFGSPYWANKSESWGRQNVLRIGMTALWSSNAVLVGLCLWPTGNPQVTFSILIIARCVYGFVASGIPAVTQAVHNDHTTNANSAQAMISHSLSLNIGRIVGLLIVVLYAGNLTGSLLTFFLILTAVYLFSFWPSKGEQKRFSPTVETSQLRRKWKDEFFQIRWLLAIAFIFSAFAEAINFSLAVSIKTALSISSAQSSEFTARLLLFACIGVAIMQVFNRVFLVKIKQVFHFYIGIGALSLGISTFGFSSTILHFCAAVGFFIIGLALIPPYYMSILRFSKEGSHYGKRAGLLSAAHTIGSTSGVTISALAASLHSFSLVVILLFMMVFLMTIFNSIHSLKSSTGSL